MRISHAFLVALLASGAACSDSSAPTATDTTPVPGARYTVRDLTPTIGDSSTVMRLSNNGELLGIAGTSLDPAKRPFLWNDGSVQLVNGCNYAEDLNDSGAVLCLINPGALRVAIWRDGVVTPFVPFDTLAIHASQQFNDSGYVTEATANVSECGTAHYCALVVGRSTLTVMPSVVAMTSTIAINGRGDVLAQGDIDAFYDQPALLFDAAGGTVRSIVPGRNGEAVAMNDSAHVVGWDVEAVGGDTAWYWHDGTMERFGPGAAASINNSDIVVGTNGNSGFRWHKGSAPAPLDSLIDDPNWTIESASLINDAGQIVATGSNTVLGVKHHTVLLDPKPSSP